MVGLSSLSRKYKLMYDIVKSHTSIPVPRVLDWACDENNQVGAEYIIMEHAEGVQLHDIWPTMDSHQHMLVTKALAKAATEMANIAFPAYGSLYFDNPAIGLERKIEFADGFVIGPQCGREYWDCLAERTQHRYQRSTNRGPCKYLTIAYPGYSEPR